MTSRRRRSCRSPGSRPITGRCMRASPGLIATFSEALDPASALSPANYTLLGAGRGRPVRHQRRRRHRPDPDLLVRQQDGHPDGHERHPRGRRGAGRPLPSDALGDQGDLRHVGSRARWRRATARPAATTSAPSRSTQRSRPLATAQAGDDPTRTSPHPSSSTGTDPAGLPLTYAIATSPAHGTPVRPRYGDRVAVTYTPGTDYFGADSFTFSVTDGHNAPVTGTVTLYVRHVITSVADGVTTTRVINQDGSVVLTSQRPDGGSPTRPIRSPTMPAAGPSAGSNSTGQTATWNYNQDGSYTLAYAKGRGPALYVLHGALRHRRTTDERDLFRRRDDRLGL